MTRRDLKALDLFFQLDADFLHGVEASSCFLRSQPAADLYETANAVVIRIELPGVRPEDLNITLSADNRFLTIRGERPEMQQGPNERVKYYQLEIICGVFEREIALPANIRFDCEAITANYKDGILVITLPKRSTEAQKKRSIEVSSD